MQIDRNGVLSLSCHVSLLLGLFNTKKPQTAAFSVSRRRNGVNAIETEKLQGRKPTEKSRSRPLASPARQRILHGQTAISIQRGAALRR